MDPLLCRSLLFIHLHTWQLRNTYFVCGLVSWAGLTKQNRPCLMELMKYVNRMLSGSSFYPHYWGSDLRPSPVKTKGR
jgi:hypothetical protein